MMNVLVLPELNAATRDRPAAAVASASGPPTSGWYFIAALGAAFAVLGGVDLALTWYPLAFGNPQWEFGTVTQTLDGLPVFTLGLVLSLGAAVARQSWRVARVISALMIVLAVLILSMIALYLTDIPLALRAVPEPDVRVGLMKAIAKTSAQAVVYPLAFVWMGLKGWHVSAASKGR